VNRTYADIEPARADVDALAGPTVIGFGSVWAGPAQRPQLPAHLRSSKAPRWGKKVSPGCRFCLRPIVVQSERKVFAPAAGEPEIHSQLKPQEIRRCDSW